MKTIRIWKREDTDSAGKPLKPRCIAVGARPPGPGRVFDVQAKTVPLALAALAEFEKHLPKFEGKPPEVREALMEPYPAIGRVHEVEFDEEPSGE